MVDIAKSVLLQEKQEHPATEGLRTHVSPTFPAATSGPFDQQLVAQDLADGSWALPGETILGKLKIISIGATLNKTPMGLARVLRAQGRESDRLTRSTLEVRT